MTVKLNDREIVKIENRMKNMRDPKRIKRILKLIEKIWTKHPDLRLTQLIGNCFDAEDLYYIQDECLELKLIETYLKDKK